MNDFETFKNKCSKRGLVKVFERICESHGIRLADVFGRGKSKSISRVRAECWAYTRRLGWSFTEIGTFWERDHTTILSATRKLRATHAEEETAPKKDLPTTLPTRMDDLERRIARLERALRSLVEALR